MICKKCGFSLSSHANFCPGCGNKITEEDRQEIHSPKHPAKWFKILFGFILVGLVASILVLLFSDNITDVVSDQLKAIKDNKLTEAYYSYTSKAFQKSTTLERFRQFIQSYPIFSHNKSVRFIDRMNDDNTGSLQAMILTDQGEIPVAYGLVKEGDQWLIENIKLEDAFLEKASTKSNNEEMFDDKPLKSAINELMNQIHQGNLSKAYQEYTSQDFQKTTSFKEFEEFVKENPDFSTDQKVEFNDLSFDNNIATMKGVLKGSDGKQLNLEYDLIEENGAWKVFHVKLFRYDADKAGQELVFSKFILGTELNEHNIVKTPTTVFTDASEEIFLNLYIEHIKAGTVIEVIFEHVDTGSSIPPVSKIVSDAGDVILAFVFSPPEAGWPKGNYRLVATSSTGKSSSFDFKVEE